MSGDGVSLPTTLSQLGSVAKTQARGQQSSQQVTPFSEQLSKKEELHVQRVKETPKAEEGRINPDEEKEDKRKRRRLRRQRKLLTRIEDQDESENKSKENPDQTNREALGSLIDLRV